MSDRPLNADQIDQFARDGFLFVESFLDTEETQLLQDASRSDYVLAKHARHVKDASGRATQLTLWNHPGDDIYGAIACSHRMVDSVEQLLGDEVYHYHSKLSAKQPKGGGAWEWHQDYGYWYNNGCLYPDMLSVFIAIDRCTRENGCMQVLRGSHLMGRIAHGVAGEQTGADLERVEEAKKRLELVYCEMEPGTALFFHGNLLHTSAPNLSDLPRWGLICCFNTKHNDPYKEHHHPRYTPLKKRPDSAIKEMGLTTAAATQKFLRHDEEAAAR